jgi:hypothetical protein
VHVFKEDKALAVIALAASPYLSVVQNVKCHGLIARL